MAASYTDSGIVLRRTDIRDNDRILTILTRDHGKVSALARGLRKPTAKLAAHVDLFAIAELSFATGYNLEILTGAVRHPDSYFTDGLEALAYASILAEVVDRSTEPSTPVPALYELLSQALVALAPAGPRRPVVLWHSYRLLDWMGHAPLLSQCAQCGTPLPPGPLAFSPPLPAVFFAPTTAALGPSLPLSTRPLLSLLAASDAAFFAFPFDASDLHAIETVLFDLFEENLPTPLRSRRFLRSLSGLAS